MTKLADINLLSIGNTIQLSGVVYSGEGRHFVCMFPDEQGPLPLALAENLDMNRDDWMRFIRQTDLTETEMVSQGVDGQLVKTVIRKSQRQIDQVVSWKVFKRDGYRCRYCGADDTPLTVDHIICWEEGGPSTEDNLLSACRKCNRTRGNMKYEDWICSRDYLERSGKLSTFSQQLNRRVVETLSSIPWQVHKRSR